MTWGNAVSLHLKTSIQLGARPNHHAANTLSCSPCDCIHRIASNNLASSQLARTIAFPRNICLDLRLFAYRSSPERSTVFCMVAAEPHCDTSSVGPHIPVAQSGLEMLIGAFKNKVRHSEIQPSQTRHGLRPNQTRWRRLDRIMQFVISFHGS